MEFPDLEKQYSWQQCCYQLDFFPFIGENNSRQVFYKEHYLTSAYDCKCLIEFCNKSRLFLISVRKTVPEILSTYYALIVIFISMSHHHGCRYEFLSSEPKKQVVLCKNIKEQFEAAKEAVKKAEHALRETEATQLQPLTQKVSFHEAQKRGTGRK